ncbi:MAG: O-antigen ligase family protein [Fimbriimonas sp.]|nr:O-antigen ligase family protein [Fimbriimonas sp.]
MIKRIDLPLILLALAAFLTPLIGGQIATDAMAFDPGGNALFSAISGALETPILSHSILALLCSASLAIMLFQRKILQVPNNWVSGALLILFSVILASVGYSEFKGTSIAVAIEWLAYGVAFFSVVAACGRQRGPLIIAAALFAGCVLLALLGIREYGQNKAIDPTHRIFPQWVGPNAMAAMLLIGLFLGMALAIQSERLIALAVSAGCVAIGIALFLTQSKGAILSLGVCLILNAVLLVVWVPRKQLGKAFGTAAAIIVCIGALAAAMSMRPTGKPGSSSGTPLGRIENTSTNMEQSVGFRSLLWKSAVKLIEQDPVGSGIGTFQFESARPGLVTQTHLAHQAYLQLAEEVSPFALLVFACAVGYWTRLLFKGGANLASNQSVLRAGVACAVGAVLVHSLVDSDLSYFGIGLAMFMLMGLGMLLSTDAVAPEYLPPVLRRTSMVAVCIFSLFFSYLGYVEAGRAQVRGLISARQYDEAKQRLESLRSMAPWDADAISLSAQMTSDPKERMQFAKDASDMAPSPRNLRSLARVQEETGHLADATSTLQRVLLRDPNNMPALKLLADVQAKGGFEDEARKTLQRMVQTEQTSYFKVRSLPELVVTDTYEARLVLSKFEKDPQKIVDLLQTAVDGYREYAKLTMPNVLRFMEAGGGMDYGGESPDRAKAKMTDASQAAKDLAAAYRALGKPELAAEADAAGKVFAGALDSLSLK